MKAYNPKDWFKVLFDIQKSDTLWKLFPLMIFVAVYSLGIAYWEIEYLKLSEKAG
jgi:putative membrane protein